MPALRRSNPVIGVCGIKTKRIIPIAIIPTAMTSTIGKIWAVPLQTNRMKARTFSIGRINGGISAIIGKVRNVFLKVMDPSVVTLIKNNRVRTPLLLSASHYHPRSRDPFFKDVDRKLM